MLTIPLSFLSLQFDIVDFFSLETYVLISRSFGSYWNDSNLSSSKLSICLTTTIIFWYRFDIRRLVPSNQWNTATAFPVQSPKELKVRRTVTSLLIPWVSLFIPCFATYCCTCRKHLIAAVRDLMHQLACVLHSNYCHATSRRWKHDDRVDCSAASSSGVHSASANQERTNSTGPENKTFDLLRYSPPLIQPSCIGCH